MRAQLILFSLATTLATTLATATEERFEATLKADLTFSPQDAALYVYQLKQAIYTTHQSMELEQGIVAYSKAQLGLLEAKKARYGLLDSEAQLQASLEQRVSQSAAQAVSLNTSLFALLHDFTKWEKRADMSKAILIEPSFRLLPERKPRPGLRLPAIDSRKDMFRFSTTLNADLHLGR